MSFLQEQKRTCIFDVPSITAMDGGNANSLSGTSFAHGGHKKRPHKCGLLVSLNKQFYKELLLILAFHLCFDQVT
jgi:hypothetical protein